MIVDTIGFDRSKGSQADVERDIDSIDPSFLQASKNVVGEVKTGRRSGDRTIDLREHGLIARSIAGAFDSFADIGRKRNEAVSFQEYAGGLLGVGPNRPPAGAVFAQ